MKSVTAFVGSARKHGVTYRATRQFLDDLQTFGDIRSELLFLSEFIERMTRSDGVVLASPVYSFQVSAHMKAFLDRLGFAFHRPSFHGKAYTSLVVEGLYSSKPRVCHRGAC